MSQLRSIQPIKSGLGLRELQAVLAIAELGSFRAAAAALGFTQSALSHQVSALEAALGQSLFDRPGGRAAGRPVWGGPRRGGWGAWTPPLARAGRARGRLGPAGHRAEDRLPDRRQPGAAAAGGGRARPRLHRAGGRQPGRRPRADLAGAGRGDSPADDRLVLRQAPPGDRDRPYAHHGPPPPARGSPGRRGGPARPPPPPPPYEPPNRPCSMTKTWCRIRKCAHRSAAVATASQVRSCAVWDERPGRLAVADEREEGSAIRVGSL